ncbi:MAG: RDD family protein [Egibacteraceae bacterium]
MFAHAVVLPGRWVTGVGTGRGSGADERGYSGRVANPPYPPKPPLPSVRRPRATVRWRASTPQPGVAGWLSRAGSAIVDQLVCLAILAPIAIVTIVVGLIGALFSKGPSSGGPGLLGIAGYATLVAGAVTGPYYVLMEGRRAGQTLGKMAANVRVVDQATGGRIGWGQAVVRWLVRLLFWVTVPVLTFGAGVMLPLLDVLWPLWDQRKQTLHDKLARTLVVTTVARSPWAYL